MVGFRNCDMFKRAGRAVLCRHPPSDKRAKCENTHHVFTHAPFIQACLMHALSGQAVWQAGQAVRQPSQAVLAAGLAERQTSQAMRQTGQAVRQTGQAVLVTIRAVRLRRTVVKQCGSFFFHFCFFSTFRYCYIPFFSSVS